MVTVSSTETVDIIENVPSNVTNETVVKNYITKEAPPADVVYVKEDKKNFKSGTRQDQITMTVLIAVIVSGISAYLLLNCIQNVRGKANMKSIKIDDTEIQYESTQRAKIDINDADESA